MCSSTLLRTVRRGVKLITIEEIRRNNLARLIGNKRGGKARFARKLGRNASQFHQILVGDRQMGRKLARDLEKELYIDRMWFDIDRTGYSEKQEAEEASPHDLILLNKIKALNSEKKTIFVYMIDEALELDRRRKADQKQIEKK